MIVKELELDGVRQTLYCANKNRIEKIDIYLSKPNVKYHDYKEKAIKFHKRDKIFSVLYFFKHGLDYMDYLAFIEDITLYKSITEIYNKRVENFLNNI